MGLRDAIARVNSIISDLSSLHVQTYTGEVAVDLAKLPEGEHAMHRVRDTVAKAKADGKINLVAEAYYQFDGDSYNFLTSANVPARALEMHTAAVEAGQKTRQALLELVRDVFK